MFLNVAVFLQPLLPAKFQIAQVCITIAELVIKTKNNPLVSHHEHSESVHAHEMQNIQLSDSQHQHHLDHHCIFCTVYGHLVAHLSIEIKETLQRIKIRLLAFKQTFRHVFFVLHRLFLNPQGRAPPLIA